MREIKSKRGGRQTKFTIYFIFSSFILKINVALKASEVFDSACPIFSKKLSQALSDTTIILIVAYL